MNILQKIFTDHYEEMLYILHPRDSVIENVDKMINCGDPSFGGAMYGCPKCGKLKFVPFDATAVSVPPAVTSIPWNALPLCPLSLSMSPTGTVSSLSMKTSGLSFSKIVLC